MRFSPFPQRWTPREICLWALSFLITVAFAKLVGAESTSGVFLADNAYLTITMITREALRVLENNLVFAKRVNRQFDDKFGVEGAKIGTVLNVRKPPRYITRTGQALQVQDAVETQVPVTLSDQVGVDLNFNSADLALSIDDFSDRFIQPAIAAIANKVDFLGMQQYVNIPGLVGTPGTTPNALLTYLLAGVVLDNNAAPMDGQRSVIITPLMQATIVDALKGLFQQAAAIASQYEKGQMGTAAGFDWYMDQNVATHTWGTQGGAGLMNGATLQGATSIVTDGWSNTITNLLRRGDVITIGSVFGVNPQSRQSTGSLAQFVVTANVNSDGGGNATIPVYPPIIAGDDQQFATVNALPADGAAITVAGGSAVVSPQGLAMHKDCFTLAAADLPLPRGVDMASRVADKQLGISVRMIRDYDINQDAFPTRLDILIGWSTLRPELGCRVAA